MCLSVSSGVGLGRSALPEKAKLHTRLRIFSQAGIFFSPSSSEKTKAFLSSLFDTKVVTTVRPAARRGAPRCSKPGVVDLLGYRPTHPRHLGAAGTRPPSTAMSPGFGQIARMLNAAAKYSRSTSRIFRMDNFPFASSVPPAKQGGSHAGGVVPRRSAAGHMGSSHPVVQPSGPIQARQSPLHQLPGPSLQATIPRVPGHAAGSHRRFSGGVSPVFLLCHQRRRRYRQRPVDTNSVPNAGIPVFSARQNSCRRPGVVDRAHLAARLRPVL